MRLRRKITYPHVAATLALMVALGGTSYAAIKIPANSVGTAQLKRSAVTASKVKPGSLTAIHFAPGVLQKLPKAIFAASPGVVNFALPAGETTIFTVSNVPAGSWVAYFTSEIVAFEQMGFFCRITVGATEIGRIATVTLPATTSQIPVSMVGWATQASPFTLTVACTHQQTSVGGGYYQDAKLALVPAAGLVAG